MRRAKPKTELGTEQARRVIYMYNKFLEGNSYSSAEMYDEVLKVFKVNLSLRTVQRDLRTLHEMAANMEQVNVGRQVYWRLSKNALSPKYLNQVDANDLMGLHYLKAALRPYLNSPSLGKEVEKLVKKVETSAPGSALLEEAQTWINEHGKVNYKNYSSVFEEIINAIIEKKWLNITYQLNYDDEIHHQFAIFKGFFSFKGSIILIAFVPRKHRYVAIPLENITKTSPAQPYNEFVPEFNVRDFFENRIGVNDGELIVLALQFKGENARIFGTRQWHPKQIVSTDADGMITIRFNVIFNKELVDWIIGLGSTVKVVGPETLVVRVKEELKKTISLYEE